MLICQKTPNSSSYFRYIIVNVRNVDKKWNLLDERRALWFTISSDFLDGISEVENMPNGFDHSWVEQNVEI